MFSTILLTLSSTKIILYFMILYSMKLVLSSVRNPYKAIKIKLDFILLFIYYSPSSTHRNTQRTHNTQKRYINFI